MISGLRIYLIVLIIKDFMDGQQESDINPRLDKYEY